MLCRDIKPENLLFRTPNLNSDLVLIDYGLALDLQGEAVVFSDERAGSEAYVRCLFCLPCSTTTGTAPRKDD